MTPTRPNWQLLVSYPDGRKDSYVLDYRQYRIGSGVESDVRISEPEVAHDHLLLFVEQEGIFAVNLQPPHRASLNGEPLIARTRWKVGDEIRVADVRLLLDVVPEDIGEQGETPDGLGALEDSALHDLKGGWLGYRRLLERVAPFISPAEAEQTQCLFQKGMRTLGGVTAVVLLLAVASVICESRRFFAASSILQDMSFALAIVGSLVLSGAFHIGFAGRILLPLTMGIASLDPPESAWDFQSELLMWVNFTSLAILFFWGWGLDYGATAFCRRSADRATLKCVVLFLIGITIAGLTILTFITSQNLPFPWFSLVAAVLCLVWPWYPGSWLRRRTSARAPDVISLSHMATIRWLKLAAGRTLAIALGLMPLFLLLGSLGLRERIAWPEDEDALISFDTNNTPHVWFWYNRGRYLRKTDFASNEIYQVSPSTFTSTNDWFIFYSNILVQSEAVQKSPTNPAPYRELQVMLAPYRLSPDTAMNFGSLGGDPSVTFFLETQTARPTRENPNGFSIFHAQELVGALAHNEDTIERLASACGALIWPAAVFGLLGGVLLWRRGGDSPLGRWLGIWLMAQTGGLLQGGVSNYLLPSLCYDLWKKSLMSPVASILYAWIELFNGLSVLLFLLGILSRSIVWVLLCWPSLKNVHRSGWSSALRFTGKVVLVTFVAVSFGVLGGSFLELWLRDLSEPLANFIVFLAIDVGVLLLGYTVGWILRRRRRHLTEAPILGPLFLLAGFASLASIWSVIPIFPGAGNPWGLVWEEVLWEAPPDWIPWLKTLSMGFALLAGFSFVLMVIRHQFLRLLSPSDLRYALLAGVLPFLFETGENIVQNAVQGTLLFSGTGTQILGVAVVVLVLGPLWRLLGQALKLISVHDLRRIEQDVEKTLENLIDTSGVSDIRQEISETLKRMKIEQYAFYSRGTGGRFDLHMSRAWPKELLPTLEISKFLRTFLGRKRELIDMSRVAFDWPYFFQSFELWRLMKKTGCRYLLPICLGPSVRGILITPETEITEGSPSDFLVEDLNTVALAALTHQPTLTGAGVAR